MVVGRCNGTQVFRNRRDLVGIDYCPQPVPNSSGLVGDLQIVGSPLADENDLTLLATDLPVNTFGLFLVSQTQGQIVNPGGSFGLLCIDGSIGRFDSPGEIQNTGP